MKKSISLQITDMHCGSCAVNIDLDLEEVEGIISSKTNYAKMTSIVKYDASKVDPEKIIQTIKNSGYTAQIIG